VLEEIVKLKSRRLSTFEDERRLRLIERQHMALAGHSQLDHRDLRYWHETDMPGRPDDVCS
jgi:hypothetical protein